MMPHFKTAAAKKALHVIDDRGRTAFHAAVAAGDAATVDFFIRGEADVAITDHLGRGLITEAALHKQFGLIPDLLAAGAGFGVGNTIEDDALHAAIAAGHELADLEKLAALGAPVHIVRDIGGLLHAAVTNGRADVIAFLVERGAPLDALDEWGRSALHLAAQRGAWMAAEKLIAFGADPLAAGRGRVTALHAAADAGDVAMLSLLLRDARVREKINLLFDMNGKTPLMTAAASKKYKPGAISMLIAAGAIANLRNNTGHSAIYHAAASGTVEAVREMLSSGADAMPADGAEKSASGLVLHHISDQGYAQKLQLLLDHGALIDTGDAFGGSPLFEACANDALEKVRTLLHAGADPNMVNAYRRRPIDKMMDDDEKYPLLSDKADIIEALLKHGADPNICPLPVVRHAPLHHNIRFGHEGLTQLMIDRGADIDCKDRTPAALTPFLTAASVGRLRDAKMLAAAGANVRLRDTFNRAALHLAAKGGHEPMLSYLLTLENVEINAQDKNGHTALHYACADNRVSAAKALLAAGADRRLTNIKGRSALDMAEKAKHQEIIALLRSQP